MGMFSTLMNKIFHRGAVAEHPYDARPAVRPGGGIKPATGPGAAPGGVRQVDVTSILDKLAAASKEKLDWKHSIVDLMKLVGMDSSISARKDLAADLHYTGDTNDSAKMNMWLHKEVMRKLAENGGKVPADLLSH